MGKKIRKYSIFVLFLLMSMSVFAKKGGIPAWQTDETTTVVEEVEADKITTSVTSTGKGSTLVTTAITTGKTLIDGTNVTYKVTIIEGQGGGNSLSFSSIEFDNDSVGIKLILVGSGQKALSGFEAEIDGNDWSKSLSHNLTSNTNKKIWTFVCGSLNSTPAKSMKIKYDSGMGGYEGNGETVIIEYGSSSLIEIKTYEKANGIPEVFGEKDGDKITVIDDSTEESDKTYYYTKGGKKSYEEKPVIYVTIPEYIDENKKIKKLDFKKLKENGATLAEKSMNVSGEPGDIVIDYDFFGNEKYNFTEGAHIVQVISTNGNGDKVTKKLNFIVDTKVNDTYLGDGIIGELDSDGKIVIDLSKLEELSGIDGYSYTFTVGDEEKPGNKGSINDSSFTSLKPESTDEVVIIDPSGLKDGSKGTLLFTVYDKLGHEKTFEKTYFIPTKPTGITSKIEGEVKQRNSRIKIVTEGNKDKFGIGSSISGSSEDETTISEKN